MTNVDGSHRKFQNIGGLRDKTPGTVGNLIPFYVDDGFVGRNIDHINWKPHKKRVNACVVDEYTAFTG